LNNKKFVEHFTELEATKEIKLTNVPREYEKTNPAAEYLKLKSFIATKPIRDAELTHSLLLSHTVKAFQALAPLVRFLNNSFA
jgi:hypothetical protein